MVLAWPLQRLQAHDWIGPLAVFTACLCWAIDNHLTRKVSATDALFVAGFKGLVAGLVNCSLALFMGARLADSAVLAPTLTLGFREYGVSLVLFVLALRGLGSARTGAYFSTAPFLGAAIAILAMGEPVTSTFWVDAVLMGVGVWAAPYGKPRP